MTEEELEKIKLSDLPLPVRVVASDYQYDGWIVIGFAKRNGKIRAVVEDPNGRLFIHNAGQLHSAL